MTFLSHWLADAIRLALALAFALLAMQIPALTHDVLAGLQQVAIASRRDIDQREDAVRDRYHLSADNDAALIEALSAKEPANADGLRASIASSQAAQSDAGTIGASPPLLQPLTAARIWLSDQTGTLQPVVTSALRDFVPQIVLSAAAAVYGFAGLLLGSFLANLLLATFAGGRARTATL